MADTPTPAPTGQTAKTAAAAGSGTALTIILLSIGLHLNIHLTEEEAVAWGGAITAAAGWIGHRLEKRLDAKQQAELAALETDGERLASNPAVQALIAQEVAKLQAVPVRPAPTASVTSTTVVSAPGTVQSGGIIIPVKPAAPVSAVLGPSVLSSSTAS